LNDARDLLLAFDYVNIDDGIVQAAMDEPDRSLRSLDAIHPPPPLAHRAICSTASLTDSSRTTSGWARAAIAAGG